MTESLNPYIDNNFSFNEYVAYLCATANRTLHALPRVSKYINLKTHHVLMRSFIISQFSYFSLIWMTYSSGLKNKANNIHERAMRIVYKDFSSSFEGLLAKDYSVTIYTRNMQQLLIETFKVKIRIFPIIMK